MTITPDQARELLDGATTGPWRALHDQWEDEGGTPCEDFYVLGGPDGILYTEDFDPDTHNPVANTTLAAASPDLAQTIAGMTEVWAVEEQADDGGWWRITTWHMNREDLDSFHDRPGRRLVRRLVGPVEVAE